MSEALPDGHYCLEHQGNHSHYSKENCVVCRQNATIATQAATIERLESELRQSAEHRKAQRQRLAILEPLVPQLRAEIERQKEEYAIERHACNLAGIDATRLKEQLATVTDEVERLQYWKESAISVTPPMQEIGEALGVRLGESIHDKILPRIQALRTGLAAVEKERDEARKDTELLNKLVDGTIERLQWATSEPHIVVNATFKRSVLIDRVRIDTESGEVLSNDEPVPDLRAAITKGQEQ